MNPCYERCELSHYQCPPRTAAASWCWRAGGDSGELLGMRRGDFEFELETCQTALGSVKSRAGAQYQTMFL
jgi:hypothetical protein